MKRSPMKPGKPLQRSTPMRRASFKSKAGAGLKCAGTTKSPRYTGPTKKMRDAVLARDDYTCQRCGRGIHNQPYSLQHLLPRGRGGKNTMRNLVTVCGSATTPGMCHDWMENQERRLATRDGWLVPNGINPDDWPVLRFGQRYETPGDEWSPAEAHPRQIEMGAAA